MESRHRASVSRNCDSRAPIGQERPLGARLLYVVNCPTFFVSHRLPLALAARDAGFDTHVATPDGAEVEAIREEGLTFHPIRLSRRGKAIWQEIAGISGLLRLYRTLRPEIVHHGTIKPVIYGGLAARLSMVPGVVNSISGLGYVFIARGLRASALRHMVKRGYRAALGHGNSVTIFQNPDDEISFVRSKLLTKSRTRLIKGSGVDMNEFQSSGEPSGTPIVLLASRMLWDKGVQEFVDAAQRIRGLGKDVRFVLVGDSDPGNPTSIPRQQLESWRESGCVEWWGKCSNMPQVLARAQIVCLPSYREGLPRVLIEAAATGRPIVTSDAPGCREVVRDGQNGILVPVRNSEAVARALLKLLGDVKLRQEMGARGRNIAETEFSLDSVVRQTLSAYDEILEAGGYHSFSDSRRPDHHNRN